MRVAHTKKLHTLLVDLTYRGYLTSDQIGHKVLLGLEVKYHSFIRFHRGTIFLKKYYHCRLKNGQASKFGNIMLYQ